MKHSITPLMFFSLVLLVVVLSSWLFIPGWSNIPGGIFTLIGVAAIGLIGFFKDGISFVKEYISVRQLLDTDIQQLENHDLFTKEDDSQITNIQWEARDLDLVNKYIDMCSEFDSEFNKGESDAIFLDYCISMGLARKVSGKTFLTQAGVLLFCQERLFPHSKYYVDIIFKDRENDLSKDISFPILKSYFMISELLVPLTSEWRNPKERSETGQESKFSFYPRTAIVEALVNFFIHRDYSKDDIGYVTISSDRIEFENPGQSLYPVNELQNATEALKPEYKRNPRLVKAFRKTGLNQREGLGIIRIRQELKDNESFDENGNLGMKIENDVERDRFRLIIYKKAPSRLPISAAKAKIVSSKFVLAPLPKATNSFVGRKDIQKKIKSVLLREDSSSTITISGMGGIGKTSLALQIVNDNEIQRRFGGNVFWGDMLGHSGNASRILRGWGEICGYDFSVDASEMDLSETIRFLLAERQQSSTTQERKSVLVVIDDLRQEWLEAGKLLRNSVPANIPVLITSRELKVAKSLNDVEFNLDVLSETEAQQVLIELSEKSIPKEKVSDIAKLCGYMPLALLLAAKVAKNGRVNLLLDRLQSSEKRLATLALDNPGDKGESVRKTFDISYESLPHETKKIFRTLAAFAPASIISTHVEAILNLSKYNDFDIDAELERLRNYSLIQLDFESEEFGGIYRLHALLYDYIQDLIRNTDEEPSLRTNHFAFYQPFSLRYEGANLGEQKNAFEEFSFMLPQLEQAFHNFINVYEKNDTEVDGHAVWAAADLARRIGRVLSLQGQLDTALSWMDRCSKVLGEGESEETRRIRALMHIHTASIDFQKRDVDKVIVHCEEGIKIAKGINYHAAVGEGYNLLGAAQGSSGQFEQASESFRLSLVAWRKAGDEYQIKRVEDNVRTALYYSGYIGELREEEDKSVAYWSKNKNRIEYAMALTNRGLIHHIDGEFDEAIKLHGEAMVLSDKLGVLRMRANTRLNIAWSYLALGIQEENPEFIDKAEVYLNESLELGADEFILDAKRCLAEIEIGRKHYEKAIELAEETRSLIQEDLAPEDVDSLEEGTILRVLGHVHRLQKNFEQAKEYLEDSLNLLYEDEYKYEEYLTAYELYSLYKATNNIEDLQRTQKRIEVLRSEIGLDPSHKPYFYSIGERASHI